MVMFLLQSALLLAIAFLLGCVVGCLLHRYLAASAATVPAAGDKKIDEAPAKLESSAEPALKPAAEPAMTARPEPAAAPLPVATATGKDDLKRIRGIGKQNEKRLNDAGITRYSQIAGWTAGDQKQWGEKLAFPGRIEREDWVGQAKVLAEGGDTKFSKRVKSGDVPTSQ